MSFYKNLQRLFTEKALPRNSVYFYSKLYYAAIINVNVFIYECKCFVYFHGIVL